VRPIESALDQVHKLNPKINAFITVFEDAAAQKQRRGPLADVPVSLKDLIYTAGIRTTAGSKHLADFTPKRDAEVVRRLRAAGAVFVGKNNLHEWAYGVTSNNQHYGPVRNPHDPTRVPGGSSGGSAAAVAAGMGPVSIGTDTGGSIRVPASLCGVVGLKPTFGAVSLEGVIPLSPTMDHVGPITDTVDRAALVFEVISGRKLGAIPPGVKRLRIGVPEEFFFERINNEVEEAVRAAIERLAQAGAKIKKIEVPMAAEANENGRTVLLVEAVETHRKYADRRAEYGDAVRALLEKGDTVTPAQFRAAKKAVNAFKREFAKLWSGIDALIMPTVPITAPLIGQDSVNIGGQQEEVRACLTRFMRPFNLSGVPALSVPCGEDRLGLPIGIQSAAAKRGEAMVLRIGKELEPQMNTDKHR
jgi:aspartyl-tRNA(Asn)/glutamyl-tRNA(Gln) amidotransferase subunit A